MDTNTHHFTQLALRMRGKKVTTFVGRVYVKNLMIHKYIHNVFQYPMLSSTVSGSSSWLLGLEGFGGILWECGQF